MFELLFFWAGIGMGIVLYGVIAVIFLLVVYLLIRKTELHWLKITLLASRPVVDLFVFYFVIVMALEIFSNSGSKNLPYNAGEVAVGCLPAAFVGFVLDVVGGIISIAKVPVSGSGP